MSEHMNQHTEGIDAIACFTEAWVKAAQFFADWGLKNVSHNATLQEWETLNGARVNVRRTGDATLPPPIEAGPTLRGGVGRSGRCATRCTGNGIGKCAGL